MLSLQRALLLQCDNKALGREPFFLARMLAKVSDGKGTSYALRHRGDRRPTPHLLEGLRNVLGRNMTSKLLHVGVTVRAVLKPFEIFYRTSRLLTSQCLTSSARNPRHRQRQESFHATGVFHRVCCRPRIDYSRRGGRLLCHSKGRGARNSRCGPAENRAWKAAQHCQRNQGTPKREIG